MSVWCFFCYRYGVHRDVHVLTHSIPTRRTPDLAIGIGAVLYQKKFNPEEISIQERHGGASPEIQRKTVVANLTDALEGSTIKRRKLVGLSLGIGLGDRKSTRLNSSH